MSAEIC